MRTPSTLATLILGILGLAGRALSGLVNLLVAVALIPVRVAMVESQWFLEPRTPYSKDPTEALLVSSWHFTKRRPVARSGPAPDPADPPA